MKKGRFTAFITALCISVSYTSFAADIPETMIAGERFDSVATNSAAASVSVTGAPFSRVIKEDDGNKAFMVDGTGGNAVVTMKYTTAEKKYIVSFDLKGENTVNGQIGLKSGSTVTGILKVTDGRLITSKGEKIAFLSKKGYSGIALVINKKRGIYSVYLDNKLVLENRSLPSNAAFDALQLNFNMTAEDKLYLDNMYIYPGTDVIKDIERSDSSGYNASGVEFVPITDDLGDYTFFDSNWIIENVNPKAFQNATLNEKTNEIIAEKFDYKNPEKGDSIILKKSTSDDCYIDISTTISNSFKTGKKYKYFLIGGDFTCDFNGGVGGYIMLRDSKSTSKQQNYNCVTFENTGNLTVSGGGAAAGVCRDGNTFNVKVFVNLENHTLDFYVDGKLIKKDAAIGSSFNDLSLVRFMYRAGEGNGELQVKNAFVKGLDKPMADGAEQPTSMFSGDFELYEYMADKIAFHAYGELYMAEGVKHSLSDAPLYEDDELFVSVSDFNAAFSETVSCDGKKIILGTSEIVPGKGIRERDGKTLIPVKETAQKLLGKSVADDKEGLILASDNEMYFDLSTVTQYHMKPDTTSVIDKEWLSPIQYLNSFVLFDRPTAENLKKSFNEAGISHPRLYADKSDFERVKALSETDEYVATAVQASVKQAETYVNDDTVTYKFDDNFRTLNTANKVESMMLALGFAYQLTKDKKYVDAAWRNFQALAAFPDLNPAHPIDLGSYMTGFAIGYDWMYEGFTPEQREVICSAAKRLGLSVLRDAFYGGVPAKTIAGQTHNYLCVSYKWISNYNLWINRGAVAAALAFMEYDEELCADLLQNSLRSCEYGIKGFFPDGAWVESTSYWGVATSFFKNFLALKKIFGTDFRLSKSPGVSEAARFMLSIRSPMNGVYNYHDSWPEMTFAPQQFLICAELFNQPELKAARLIQTQGSKYGISVQQPSVWDALYYDPDIKAEDITKQPKMRYAAGAEIVAVHEDWMKMDGMFFAAQGGPIKVYHFHEDAGDFAFELDGVRWACSLPAEDYNSSLKSVEKYRWRAEGHNTVVINNSVEAAQNPSAFAPLINYGEGDGGAFAVYDMSEVYNDAESFRRGFYIDDNFRSLTVKDEIKLGKPNSEIYWFMHTKADARVISDNSVLLSTGDKSVTLTFEAEGAKETSISVMDAIPLESSPAGTGQNPNKGYRKVAIRLVADDTVNLGVNISSFARKPEMSATETWTAPEKSELGDEGSYGFKIFADGEECIGKASVSVYDPNRLPELEFVPEDPGKTVTAEISGSITESSKVTVHSADGTRSKVYFVPYRMNYSYPGGDYSDEYTYSEIKGFEESSAQDGNPAVNIFDGQLETRWTTLSTDESIVLDLGSVKPVDAVAAGFWKSDVRSYSFELYCSEDGKSFTKIGEEFSSAFEPEGTSVYAFDRVNARFIKYVGKGNSANVNSNVLEFRVLTRR
ncbi:MAG: discoidin domain-containing protein [Clostridia bacterium]|nr:discoidin domain-containing protein [Clostridia bacterium]